mmetsp:Transcript_6104/g.13545  ORF Transcript_6104/g.13545 Transcript_6104/m.13545 type:complete len:304 (-) Transcript_6104:168-1079(-)
MLGLVPVTYGNAQADPELGLGIQQSREGSPASANHGGRGKRHHISAGCTWDSEGDDSSTSGSTLQVATTASGRGSTDGQSVSTSLGQSSRRTSQSTSRNAESIQFDADKLDAMRQSCDAEEWQIDIQLTGTGLGIAFMTTWSKRSLVISQVNPVGSIAVWNSAHTDKEVQVGDQVVSATSTTGQVVHCKEAGPSAVLKFIKSCGSRVRLGLRRVVAFDVRISRCMDLGLSILELQPEAHLMVMQLAPDGLVTNYNSMVSPDLRVRPGDLVTSVNSRTRSLVEELRRDEDLVIHIARQTKILSL